MFVIETWLYNALVYIILVTILGTGTRSRRTFDRTKKERCVFMIQLQFSSVHSAIRKRVSVVTL